MATKSSPPSSTMRAPIESAKDTVPPLPSVGDLIDGKYKIERVLGTGGMGIVVEARHTMLGELVAIKFLRADADRKSDQAQRFLREAKATLRIKSEHVVRVHDMGITPDGHAFLVMEHLDGKDLATLLFDRGPLPIPEAVDYVLQACEGLAEAHAQGVVHRDLKPANLFVVHRADGSALVKLLDFGIAKARSDENITLTDTRAVFGSPAYMPPEQIRSAKAADARSDVWSLAVVLYELLTQHLPFTGESGAAVLASIVADTPRPLRSCRADVPNDLAAAVARCLEKDPEKRTPSVYELACALAPFARDPSSTTRVERIRRLAISSPAIKAPPKTSVRPADAALATAGVNATTAHSVSLSGVPPRSARRRYALAAGTAIAAALAVLAVIRFVPRAAPAAAAASPSSVSSAPTPTTAKPAEDLLKPAAGEAVATTNAPVTATPSAPAHAEKKHGRAPERSHVGTPPPAAPPGSAATAAIAAPNPPPAPAPATPPTADPAGIPFPTRN